MLITYLVVSALNCALLTYIDGRPADWSDARNSLFACFGWPVVIPFALIKTAYDKAIGNV